MEEKTFVWTSDLTKRLLQMRYENDWLFKKKKQPWGEFYKILLENDFPEEMTIKHVRKKYSYMYDTYKIAKRTKNKSWKHYKAFERLYGKTKILDKFESWNDEWRLKLITSISEAKDLKIDYQNLWKTVERALRCQDLPTDCCVQDLKGLWHHLRTTFNRKHRQKIRKLDSESDWPLYETMLNFYKKYEPDYVSKLETESACMFVRRQKALGKLYRSHNKKSNLDQSDDFQWSKHITESFIQIRLQNDWMFRERKWAWNDLVTIMIEEHGFPKTLTGREICRKWAATFAEYQKAKATNNKSWVYYNLFELYLGDGSLSLNPLVGWQEDWVFNLISSRCDLQHLFKYFVKDQNEGWREVEKRLRIIGIPLDHSLLDLPEIWNHLLRTYKWKRKFANKGILNEQWPYYDAMLQFVENEDNELPKKSVKKRQSFDDPPDDDYEDDIKLFDLKQKLQVKPKAEILTNQCRACACEDGSVNIYEQIDDDGNNLAHKLKVVGGIEVSDTDRLPTQICLNCIRELENAYNFRRRCQEVDKQTRAMQSNNVKIEINHEKPDQTAEDADFDESYEPGFGSDVEKQKPVKQERKKKSRKRRYDYWKICEICGKNTRNLVSHLDMHSSGKTYSCDVCDKKFKFKSGLVIHKAVHNPTPRKTCEVCGKTFHIVAQYRRHFVYHANERKFSCETCGKRFNTMDILRVHTRTHTDERPFTCSECGKTFRTAGCVSRHKRIVHRTVKAQ